MTPETEKKLFEILDRVEQILDRVESSLLANRPLSMGGGGLATHFADKAKSNAPKE